MERVKGVIEGASLHAISDIFAKKPRGLKLNETDALIVRARSREGTAASRIFYFCLKPDGTVDEETLAGDGSRSRRHRLVSFLQYYGMTGTLQGYTLRDRLEDWRGREVEILAGTGLIFVP
jgi:hypothetical protein